MPKCNTDNLPSRPVLFVKQRESSEEICSLSVFSAVSAANNTTPQTLFPYVLAMPESSAWQDICRWEFCPDHEDDDDDDDIDIDQGRMAGTSFPLE